MAARAAAALGCAGGSRVCGRCPASQQSRERSQLVASFAAWARGAAVGVDVGSLVQPADGSPRGTWNPGGAVPRCWVQQVPLRPSMQHSVYSRHRWSAAALVAEGGWEQRTQAARVRRMVTTSPGPRRVILAPLATAARHESPGSSRKVAVVLMWPPGAGWRGRSLGRPAVASSGVSAGAAASCASQISVWVLSAGSVHSTALPRGPAPPSQLSGGPVGRT